VYMLYTRQPTEDEYVKLNRMIKQSVGRISQRAHAILLSAQRRSVPELATVFGVTRETIRSWIHRFNTAGPAGLYDDRYKNRRMRRG
jgi:transposase